MDVISGLICAYRLDGNGGGAAVDWPAAQHAVGAEGAEGALWLHFERKSADVHEWLDTASGLDSVIVEALLAEDTRPRSLVGPGGLMVILRGVNLNEGADPEDMISVRLWVDEQRIITLRYPKLRAIGDVRESIEAGTGPCTPGDFIVHLIEHLLDRMAPVLEDLQDSIDALETEVIESHRYELRSELIQIRRRAIILRRYLAPQREVLSRLQAERTPVLGDRHRAQLREQTDRLLRYVEDLDALRERASITQEELAGRLSEKLNRNMYVLSLVAAVFLPLGLLTGLLGINVGGIPGSEYKWAFMIVCVILVSLAGVGVWLFRRLNFL